MKKKLIAMFTVAAICLGVAASVSAAPLSYGGYGYGCGGYGSGYGIMLDEDGNFLTQEDFEAVLDDLIENGDISADDSDYLLEMYNWCAGRIGSGNFGRLGGGCCRY